MITVEPNRRYITSNGKEVTTSRCPYSDTIVYCHGADGLDYSVHAATGRTGKTITTALDLVREVGDKLDTPNVKRELAMEAADIVDGARRKSYGTPEDNFQRIARFWQAYFENTGRTVAIRAEDVSPLMRLMKEARLCETPDHRDSFVDIVGYALTGAELNGVKSKNNT